MKIKPKFPFKGRETKGEERREKKMSPAAYKRGEMAEGKHGYKMGGRVGRKGC